MAKTDSPKSNNILKQNESSKDATSPQGVGVFSSTNKDMQNIEKVAELTATFLVPFVLAIMLFIFIAAFNTSNRPTTNYWSVLLNNPFFIFLIISVILTWFFLVIYYLFERSPVWLLKVSIGSSGISILLSAILVFLPQQIFPSNYSNFFNSIWSSVLSIILFGAVIVYWCFSICAFYRISHPKP